MDLSPLVDDSFGLAATVEDFGADFGLSFDFGASFDALFGTFDGSVIVHFDDSSIGSLFDDGDLFPHPDAVRQRRPN